MGCLQCKVKVATVSSDLNPEAAGELNKLHHSETGSAGPAVKETAANTFVNRAFEAEDSTSKRRVRLVLTQKDVLSHNAAVASESRWVTRDGHVYDYGKFCQFLLERVSTPHLRNDKQLKVLNFKYLNRKRAIKIALLEKARAESCLGFYQAPTESEKRESHRQQLLSLREVITQPPRHETSSFIKMEVNPGWKKNSFTHGFVYCQEELGALKEFSGDKVLADVCTRELMKLDIFYLGFGSGLTLTKFCTGLDPSAVAFPLPWGVRPEILRGWLATWEVFDLKVGGQGAWPVFAANVIEQGSAPGHSTLRPWLDTWENFDTAISGEAAWQVVEAGIVKDDRATEGQLAVWGRRNAVPDFYSEVCMARRRQRMVERHFPGCLEMFDNFSKRMERNLEEFEELL